jgi:hypothetical protein
MNHKTKPYNAPFFRLYETMFLVLKQELGEEQCLTILKQVFAKNLKAAYDQTNWRKGNPHDFTHVVGLRDEAVGLQVAFPTVTDTEIVYQFHTDPFPHLKGKVEPEKLDATYLEFKVSYLLGAKWSYITTKHLWRKDPYTEHVITKK